MTFRLRQLEIRLRKSRRNDIALAVLAAFRQKPNAVAVPELVREKLHNFLV